MKNILLSLSFILICNYVYSQSNRLSEIATQNNGIDWIRIKDDVNITTEDFFKEHQVKLGFNSDYTFRLLRTDEDQIGFKHHRYEQLYKGVKVEGAQYILHSMDNYVVKANGKLVNGISTDVKPVISGERAIDVCKNYLSAPNYYWEDPAMEALIKRIKSDPTATFYPQAELVITAPEFNKDASNFKLGWKIDIYSERHMEREIIFVDAINGTVLYTLDGCPTDSASAVTHYSGTQTICTDSVSLTKFTLVDSSRGGGVFTYDLNEDTDIAAWVHFEDSNNFWNNVNPEADQAATDAHWGMEMTYDYFKQKHGRLSFDNNDGAIISFVHYDIEWQNASWNGMFSRFGDGTGGDNPWTEINIAAHELTHGVTDYTSALIYQNESGALNESFSDIFGSATKRFAMGPVDEWDIGRPGFFIRSLSNPKSHGDPDTYLGQFWQTGTGDNGGVHTNSGVQNHWYYLLTAGDTGTNDNGDFYDVTGLGRDTAGAIAYRNTFAYLTPSSNYFDARQGAIQAAEDLYGSCSFEVMQTAKAWYAVGVGADSLTLDFVLLSADFTSSCGLGPNEIFSVEYKFNRDGCNGEVIAGDSIQLGYSINGDTAVIEYFVFPSTLVGGDTLNYTFSTTADLSAPGQYSLKFFINSPLDFLHKNDSLIDFSIGNAVTISNEIITFEDRLGVVDSFFTILGSNANVLVQHRAASNGSDWGLQLGSFDASTGTVTVPADTADNFIVNPIFGSKACFCVDASGWTDARMVFDLKQTYSEWYINNGFGDLKEFASVMRILINRTQIGSQYHPITNYSDNFTTHIINLDAFAGSSFEACFEGQHWINFWEDPYLSEGDHTFIDNLFFTNNTSVGIETPEDNSFSVYPNPNSGLFTLELPMGISDDLEISVSDVLGRVIRSERWQTTVSGRYKNIDLENIPGGMYFIRLSSGKFDSSQTIIVH